MWGTNVINYVAKGEEYALDFAISNKSTGDPITGLSLSYIQVNISNDGATMQTPTNSVSEIGSGFYRIILTAEEMNVDKLLVPIWVSSFGDDVVSSYVLNTSEGGNVPVPSGVSSFSVSNLTVMIKLIIRGYNLSRVDLNNNGYNYYGFLNLFNIWVIVKEKSDYSEYGYKMGNPGKKSFTNAWNARASMSYGSTLNI